MDLRCSIRFLLPETKSAPLNLRFTLPALLFPTLALLICLLIWAPIWRTYAAVLPQGFTETLVASGMSSPTAMAIAPDGRIFVCQQGGSLRVVKNGALLPDPFVIIPVNSSGERGLLGVAFDPNFAANQFVYVYYTTQSLPLHNRVSRFTASGDIAVPGSEVVLLDLNNLSATNHNGGALHFGPDGKLYIATGENATPSNSQSLNNLLGKILRINADPLNLIPPDNPFIGQATGVNQAIWALGLRNPFTFNFQPGMGRIFINDVGQNALEEINDGIAGSNYGWPACEGPCNPPNVNFSDPIHFYANDPSTCAITGGTFYNPATQQFPAPYVGKYFFADLCAGWIRYIDPANPASANTFATGLGLPVDLQVSAGGSLYYLQRGDEDLWRIDFTGVQTPAITQHPANRTVGAGQTATFTVAASGAAPLSYQWRKNGANISGANSPSYTTPATTLADNGSVFSCVVSNTFGTATSNGATLTVVANQPPTATITAPAAGTLYSGGQTINYAGTGLDPEQGALPPNAFTWEVVFHHDTHTHPFIPPFSGVTGGSFTIPTAGETATDVWYRIRLTVADSAGLVHSVFRDIFPRTSTITLASNPPGLQLTLDSQPITAPFSIQSVVGIVRTLGVASPQMLGGATYIFSSWSDGGAATHAISTPATNTTYTATFDQFIGLQYYPLPRPIRLLDTRPGEQACNTPGAPFSGGQDVTLQARGSCDGITIPANAQAIAGNATVVNFLSDGGYATIYPSNVARPNVSNLNFTVNQIVPNAFTTRLGADGAFKVFTTDDTHFIVDITGYYAPPGAGGLYYHPLTSPVRLLDTRPGENACDAPGLPLADDGSRAVNAHGSCLGATIPSSAKAIAGNATVVNFISSGFHWITLYPSGTTQPNASNLNFTENQIVPNAFVVGLGNDGRFNIYSHASTHFIVDVTGYFSNEPVDANGPGLHYYALPAPVRLLDTRPGEQACDAPGAPLADDATRTQTAHRSCSGVTIPSSAKAVVGNATVANFISSGFHWITLFPFGTAQPNASNLNFAGNQIVPNAFVVGLSNDGRFNIYSHASTHFIVDLAGYYAP